MAQADVRRTRTGRAIGGWLATIVAMEALVILVVHAASGSARRTGLGWPLPALPAVQASLLGAAGLAAMTALWFVTVRREDPGLRVVLAGAALFGLTLILAPAMTSASLPDDMGHGRVLAHYGANPYVTPASTFPPDPILGAMGRPGTTPLAGPAWITLASLTALAGRGSFTATLLIFKGLLLASHLVNGLLIGWLAAGRGGARRLLAPGAAAAFYLWNPIVIAQTMGEGRHHVVALTWLLLAIWLVRRGDETLAWGCAAMACLVDYMMVPLAALLLAQRWRRGARPGVYTGMGAGAAVIAVAFLPYVRGFPISQLLPPWWLTDTPAGARALYEAGLSWIAPAAWQGRATLILWGALAAVLLAWWARQAARVQDPEDAAEGSAVFLMAAMIGGAAAFELPAVGWALALATLASRHAVIRAAALMSAGAIALHAFELYRVLSGSAPHALPRALAAVSLVALAPPILYLVPHFRGRRSGGPREVEETA